jgi:hypothetical protein
MAWVICYVVIGVAGIGVLAVTGMQVYAQVRRLSREVSRAASRIEAARAAIPEVRTGPASGDRPRFGESVDVR